MRHLDLKSLWGEEAKPLFQPIHHGMDGRFGDRGLGSECDDRRLVGHFYGRDMEQFGKHPQLHHFQEPLHRFRRESVPVLDFPVEKRQLTDSLWEDAMPRFVPAGAR